MKKQLKAIAAGLLSLLLILQLSACGAKIDTTGEPTSSAGNESLASVETQEKIPEDSTGSDPVKESGSEAALEPGAEPGNGDETTENTPEAPAEPSAPEEEPIPKPEGMTDAEAEEAFGTGDEPAEETKPAEKQEEKPAQPEQGSGAEKTETPAKTTASFTVDTTPITIEVGESHALAITMIPADAKDEITVTTSGTGSVTAENGVLTATERGACTVTLSLGDTVAEIPVTVYRKTTELAFAGEVLQLAVGEKHALPELSASENCDVQPAWTTSNPELAVIEGSMIVPLQKGTLELTATDGYTGLSAVMKLIVSDSEVHMEPLTFVSGDNVLGILAPGGALTWYTADSGEKLISLRNVSSVKAFGANYSCLNKQGTLIGGYSNAKEIAQSNLSAQLPKGVTIADYFCDGSDSGFVIAKDGTVYARGTNTNGMLGTGKTDKTLNGFTAVPVTEVKEIAIDRAGSRSYFLRSDKTLYYAGDNLPQPQQCAEGVDELHGTGFGTVLYRKGTTWYRAADHSVFAENVQQKKNIAFTANGGYAVIDGGKLLFTDANGNAARIGSFGDACWVGELSGNRIIAAAKSGVLYVIGTDAGKETVTPMYFLLDIEE